MMKSEIRFVGVDASEALRDHAQRRIRAHLRRFAEDVSSVLVRIADVNGPRGGLDKHCRVTVKGPRVTTTVVELGADAYGAIEAAISRASRALARALDRQESTRVSSRAQRTRSETRSLRVVTSPRSGASTSASRASR